MDFRTEIIARKAVADLRFWAIKNTPTEFDSLTFDRGQNRPFRPQAIQWRDFSYSMLIDHAVGFLDASKTEESELNSKEFTSNVAQFLSDIKSPATGTISNGRALAAIRRVSEWLTTVKIGNETFKSLDEGDVAGSAYAFSRQDKLTDNAVGNVASAWSVDYPNYPEGYSGPDLVLQSTRPFVVLLVRLCLKLGRDECEKKIPLLLNLVASAKDNLPLNLEHSEEHIGTAPFPQDNIPNLPSIKEEFLKEIATVLGEQVANDEHDDILTTVGNFVQLAMTVYYEGTTSKRFYWKNGAPPHEFKNGAWVHDHVSSPEADSFLEAKINLTGKNVLWAANKTSVPDYVESSMSELAYAGRCIYVAKAIAGPLYRIEGVPSITAYSNTIAPVSTWKSDGMIDGRFVKSSLRVEFDSLDIPRSKFCTYVMSFLDGTAFADSDKFILSRKPLEAVVQDINMMADEVGTTIQKPSDFLTCKLSNTILGPYQQTEAYACNDNLRQSLHQWQEQLKVSLATRRKTTLKRIQSEIDFQYGGNVLRSDSPILFKKTANNAQYSNDNQANFSAISIFRLSASIDTSADVALNNMASERVGLFVVSGDGSSTCLGFPKGNDSVALISKPSKEECLQFDASMNFFSNEPMVTVEGRNAIFDALFRRILLCPMSKTQRHVFRRYLTITSKSCAETYRILSVELEKFAKMMLEAKAIDVVLLSRP